MVTQDANGNRRIVQADRIVPVNPVTISYGLLYNTTIPDLVAPLMSLGSSFLFE
jgi:hypothetical protein